MTLSNTRGVPPVFDEWLDARTLGNAGSRVATWQGIRGKHAATQVDTLVQPVVELVSGVKSVRFLNPNPGDKLFMDFDWPTLIAKARLNQGPLTIFTAFADTGLNVINGFSGGRAWSGGSDTLGSNGIGLNLRQSSTGLRFGAQDDLLVNTISNVFISDDGEQQRSLGTIRINADNTWDAWSNETRTVTAAAIIPGTYSGNRFTIGARRSVNGVSLYDDCALHGLAFAFNPLEQSDAKVLRSIRFLRRAYGI